MTSSSDKKTGQPDDEEVHGYASPPCYQHELDPNYLGITGLNEEEQLSIDSSWATVREWRVKTRSRLIAWRQGLTDDERAIRCDAIVENLRRAGVLSPHQGIGFYWPMAGEIDLRPLLTNLIERGTEAALPVISKVNQPLEFWRWRPGDVLDESGPKGIPVPSTRHLMAVTALLIPLVGYDDQGHRLGHGGGYYDRTLAAMDPRAVAIGVGLEECRLPSIFPQAHDIPMDIIVTDASVYKIDGNIAKRPPATDRRSGTLS